MKNIIYALALFLASAVNQTIIAQDIKLKDDQVWVDGKPTFSFDKKNMNNVFRLYQLNTTNELVTIAQQHLGDGETSAVNDYKKLVFAPQNILIESRVLRSRNWKFIIQLLMSEKVFDANGLIDQRNLERFAGKYDEKITPR